MSAIENSRPEFEMWVSSSPFEYSIERHPDGAAFPGTYRSLHVDLAWHAWCKARAEVEELRDVLGKFIEDFEGCYADGEVAMLAAKLAAAGELPKAIAHIKAQAIREALELPLKISKAFIDDEFKSGYMAAIEDFEIALFKIEGQSNG